MLMNSCSRSRVGSRAWSQYSVTGMPRTSSITKYGRPLSVAPASSTLAMFGWSISGQGLALGLEPANHLPGVHAGFDDFQGHQPPQGPLLLGHEDQPHA